MGKCNSTLRNQIHVANINKAENISKKINKIKDNLNIVPPKYIFSILPFSVYGIKKFGTQITPSQELKNPLKFEFHLSNVKGKMMKDKRVKYYI
jgi:hypothetical protein